MRSVDPPPLRCRIVHAGVVDVSNQNREPDDEVLPIGRPRRKKSAAGGARELHDARGDVAHVDDPVIGEERRVQAERRDDPAVARHRLEGGDLLDLAPEPLLEYRSEVPRETAVDRSGLDRSGRENVRHRSSVRLSRLGFTADPEYVPRP